MNKTKIIQIKIRQSLKNLQEYQRAGKNLEKSFAEWSTFMQTNKNEYEIVPDMKTNWELQTNLISEP